MEPERYAPGLMASGSFKRWAVRSTLMCSAFSTLCVAPASARAQAPAADNEALKKAREQFGQALALQTGGDWAGALALLKEVAAVKPTPQVRFNIALCEERLGRLVAALGDYELAASDAQAEKADQVRQEVDARLESLRARVPRVVVSRGEGADAATISLDGVSLGDSVLNAPLPVDPGPHVVEATGAGYQPFKQSFRVAEQQNFTVQVKLEPTPIIPELVAPVPRAAPQNMRTAGYIVGGAGIASLIASGAMFYLRHNAISDLDQQCGPDRRSCPDSARNTVDRGKLYTTLGDVTLAVGAVGLGVGAILVVVGGHSSEQASLAIAPGAVGANAGGASLVGRF
jgi:tetratricopeptide (TPR) repeat protein